LGQNNGKNRIFLDIMYNKNVKNKETLPDTERFRQGFL